MTGADVPAAAACRDGVQHAIHRLDQLADAVPDHGTEWGWAQQDAYRQAAAALREELKITGENT